LAEVWLDPTPSRPRHDTLLRPDHHQDEPAGRESTAIRINFSRAERERFAWRPTGDAIGVSGGEPSTPDLGCAARDLPSPRDTPPHVHPYRHFVEAVSIFQDIIPFCLYTVKDYEIIGQIKIAFARLGFWDDRGDRTMCAKSGLILLAAALIVSITGSSAQSSYIDYTYTTTLTLISGTDTAGLSGATVTVNALFSTTDVYVERFMIPAVVADLGTTYTISGSSNAGNNGTFGLQSMAFYPTFAGLFTEPQGSDPVASLAVGGSLTFLLNTTASTHGAGVAVGDTISLLDFAPATSLGANWFTTDGAYSQSVTSVSVALIGPSVPEPSSLALCGIAGISGLAFARLRRIRAAA
jgi:hypothetical protein